MKENRRGLWRDWRVWLGVLVVCGSLGALISAKTSTTSPEQRLVTKQVERFLPAEGRNLILRQPLALQSLMLEYQEIDPVLRSHAEQGLRTYPKVARTVLMKYGDRPEFQKVLKRYGVDAMLPVHYMMVNRGNREEMAGFLSHSARRAWDAAQFWKDDGPMDDPNLTPEALQQAQEVRVSSAITTLDKYGHDFLSQFVYNPVEEEAGRVQTKRMTDAAASFFTSGIRNLESKYKQGSAIGVTDVAWAGFDVAMGVAAFKILRAGRAATVGGRAATAGRSATTATTVASRAVTGTSRAATRSLMQTGQTVAGRTAVLGGTMLRSTPAGVAAAKKGSEASLRHLLFTAPATVLPSVMQWTVQSALPALAQGTAMATAALAAVWALLLAALGPVLFILYKLVYWLGLGLLWLLKRVQRKPRSQQFRLLRSVWPSSRRLQSRRIRPERSFPALERKRPDAYLTVRSGRFACTSGAQTSAHLRQQRFDGFEVGGFVVADALEGGGEGEEVGQFQALRHLHQALGEAHGVGGFGGERGGEFAGA